MIDIPNLKVIVIFSFAIFKKRSLPEIEFEIQLVPL